MPEIEITAIGSLTAEQDAILEMHSLLNLLNVLQGELQIVGVQTRDDPETLKESMAFCRAFQSSLTEAGKALEMARHFDRHASVVRSEIHAATKGCRGGDAKEDVENIESVLRVFAARAREMVQRHEGPERWEPYGVEGLKQKFMEVFAAIEKNSRGRYRIIYNLARKEVDDYFVSFQFEGDRGLIMMPPVMIDVVRDLMANARKYTRPGGRIYCAISQGAKDLRIHVEDTGIGIPEKELARVVEFGTRGSNVGEIRTMGGGFGLTKAFAVTRRHGGRMWISSEEGLGTRIRIVVPMPSRR